MLKRLLVLATLFLSATGASAAVLLSLDAAPTESAGIWTYNYTARLQAGAVLRAPDASISQPGDFFTLYDFIGLQQPVGSGNFTAQTNAPLGGPFTFDVTSANTGNTPPSLLVLPMDDPTIPNVTVTLTGPSNIVPQGANVTLGTLTLTSTDGGLGALAVASEFLQNGHPAGNLSSVDVSSVPIPEPSTYAFMGLGLLGVVTLAFRTRNRG
jgi:hypothetical protein